MKPKYSKQYQNPEQLVELLKARALCIADDSKAAAYIHNIGYFRLSAYLYPLLKEPKTNHQFKAGSTFKQALDIYRFDRKLRVLCFNEIEKIEVAIRSVIVNTASEFYNNPFWITDRNNFRTINIFDKTLNRKVPFDCYDGFIGSIDTDIKRSKDDFIKHFQDYYSDSYPPSWMITEILTLGTLSRIYKGLNQRSLQKKISKEFGLSPDVFESWMLSLTGLRNICCHHSRLWNRVLPLSTKSPKSTTLVWLTESVDDSRTFYKLSMIKYLLFSISPNSRFKSKLLQLLESYPTIDIAAMGFPTNWEEQPLWAK